MCWKEEKQLGRKKEKKKADLWELQKRSQSVGGGEKKISKHEKKDRPKKDEQVRKKKEKKDT